MRELSISELEFVSGACADIEKYAASILFDTMDYIEGLPYGSGKANAIAKHCGVDRAGQIAYYAERQ